MTLRVVPDLPKADPPAMSLRVRLALVGGSLAFTVLFIAAASLLPCP